LPKSTGVNTVIFLANLSEDNPLAIFARKSYGFFCYLQQLAVSQANASGVKGKGEGV